MTSSFGFTASPWTVYTESGIPTIYYTNTSVPNSNVVPPYGTSSSTISQTDLTNVVPQCGVYLINGSLPGPSYAPIAIPSSIYNLAYIGSTTMDDGFYIYPNFGIQVFKQPGYATSTSTSSVITYNATTYPIFVSTTPTNYPGNQLYLISETGTDVPYSTSPNVTQSIKVFYQGRQVTDNYFSYT